MRAAWSIAGNSSKQATMRHIAPLLAAMGQGLRNRGFVIRAAAVEHSFSALLARSKPTVSVPMTRRS